MNLKVRILIINNLRKGRFKGAMRELVRGSLIMAERGWPSRSASACEDTHPQCGIRACCGWASRAPPQ